MFWFVDEILKNNVVLCVLIKLQTQKHWSNKKNGEPNTKNGEPYKIMHRTTKSIKFKLFKHKFNECNCLQFDICSFAINLHEFYVIIGQIANILHNISHILYVYLS